jgi:hypothetical protein
MKMLRRLWWISIGAALAWFLDPEHGDERRAQAKAKFDEKIGSGPAIGTPPMSLSDETRDPLHEHAAAR